MAIEISGLNARMALDQIAKMAYGSKESEGTSGGKGNIGLVNGQVVKFNTHWTERLKSATPEMRASCNELRARLSTIATELLSPTEGDVNAAAKERVLADIRKSLGLDPAGQQVVSRKLLDRTVVAAVVQKLAEAGVHDSWNLMNVDELRGLSSKGVDTTFGAVAGRVVADKAQASQMSKDQSMPRKAMTPAQRQVFADVLGTSSADHVREFFTGPLEKSFEAAEKDLARGQRTIVNGRMFGTGDGDWGAQDSAAYRQELRRVFGGNENMLRLFNGIAHQGLLAGALQARVAGLAEPTEQQITNAMTPFAKVDQAYSYELLARPNGDYELNVIFTRQGDVHMRADGPGERLDKDNSFDEIRARIVFGPARAGEQNPYLMTVKDAEGKDQTLPYHLEVVWAESEVKLEFLTSHRGE